MFISTYENKLDKKGRVSVPAAYRSHLSTLGYNGVVCYPSFTNSSIEFCPQDRLEKIIETTLNVKEVNNRIYVSGMFFVSPQDFQIKIPSIVRDKIAKQIQINIDYELIEKK